MVTFRTRIPAETSAPGERAEDAAIVAPWRRALSRTAILAAASYVGLVTMVIVGILPGGSGSLPAEYLELAAARRSPLAYRTAIGFDVASWLTFGGFLVMAAGTYVRREPVRSTIVAALGVGMSIGLLGACLRLAGTAELGDRLLDAAARDRTAILVSFIDQQRLVNVSFAAGGLLMGTAFVVVAGLFRRTAGLPRAVPVLFVLGGSLGLAKSVLQLATGTDVGPVALLGVLRSPWGSSCSPEG